MTTARLVSLAVSAVVSVPEAKVALSTASVYPESTASAFELAARLGYDGVEVMVWTDPVSQDPEALRRLSDYHQVADRRRPRALPVDHAAGLGHRSVGEARARPRGR